MSTSSFHSRINDHALSMGMVRYSTGPKDEDKYLWKLVISKDCGSKELASIEVSLGDLTSLRNMCDKSITILQTDGDRKDKKNDR